MFYVLCEPGDEDALWLAAALVRRGEDVECILPEELMVGASLTYRIDSFDVASSMRLHDGRVFEGEAPALVLNRLNELPCAGPEADGFYIAEEWRAVVAGWLRSLRCPVVNPPSASALGGPAMSTPHWRAIGRAHGLRVREWHSGQPENAPVGPVEVVSVAGQCLDPTGLIPSQTAQSLMAVAAHVGAPLLGATFDRSEEDWELTTVTVRPRLALAGNAIVEALIRLQRTGATV
jgi:hypothetical protein